MLEKAPCSPLIGKYSSATMWSFALTRQSSGQVWINVIIANKPSAFEYVDSMCEIRPVLATAVMYFNVSDHHRRELL